MTEYEKAVAVWQQKHITTDAELSEALNAFSVLYAYHSGKIGNDNITYHDTREIFEHDMVTGYTGNLRTLFAIHDAKNAYELFLTAFGENRLFDENFIMELHGCLTENTCRYSNHADKNFSGLLEKMQSTEDNNVLVMTAYFHAEFERIHPFADGNGRTGRLAMNYFLVIHNHPPVIIYEEDRQEYYDALEMWNTEQDLRPFCDFLKRQTERTWKKQLKRAERKKNNVHN